jgi:S1-C subfamily serine protease
MYKKEIKHILPYLSPCELLKYFNDEPPNRALKGKDLKPGQSVPMEFLSLFDYLREKVPRDVQNSPKYIGIYHNTALKIAHKLVAEGLLSTWGSKTGIFQQFQGNSYNTEKMYYNAYDFLIYGFAEVVDYYNRSIRIIEVAEDKTGKIDVGTGFAILYKHKKQYFVTAKHCLPKNSEIRMKILLGFSGGYAYPENIYSHIDDNVDIAILEFSDKMALSDKFFILETPYLLDKILVSGYPPVPGTADAILVSSTGEITTMAKTYFHKYEQIYVNANVKGGSSGSPIINEYGSVVGVIIESPRDIINNDLQDELRFGTGLTSNLIFEILESIDNNGDIHNKMKFSTNSNNSFRLM